MQGRLNTLRSPSTLRILQLGPPRQDDSPSAPRRQRARAHCAPRRLATARERHARAPLHAPPTRAKRPQAASLPSVTSQPRPNAPQPQAQEASSHARAQRPAPRRRPGVQCCRTLVRAEAAESALVADAVADERAGGGNEAAPTKGAARMRAPRRQLLFVELAHEGEGEERAHVLEVRAHLHADLVPAGFAGDVLNRDGGAAKRAAAADRG